MGIEPTLPAWKAGVLPLNYTRNIKYGGEGRIRTYETEVTDLQSAPFDRSGTPPCARQHFFMARRLCQGFN
jgi:hypothetical protein